MVSGGTDGFHLCEWREPWETQPAGPAERRAVGRQRERGQGTTVSSMATVVRQSENGCRITDKAKLFSLRAS